MPLFDLKPDQTISQVALNPGRFHNEAELRDFFADNLPELLGMRFLAKEYPTTGGRMDTLALDEDESPVIIEYKWGQDDSMIPQGLFYYDWLKNNKPHVELLVQSKLGREISVNWSRPRVLLVAQGFDNRTIVGARQIDYIELVRYTPYGERILHLENLNNQKTAKRVKPPQSRPAEAEAEESPNYGIDYHFARKRSSDQVKEMFYALRELIQQLPSVEEITQQKTGVTYRTTKSFLRIEFGPNYLNLLIRRAAYDDPRHFVRDITANAWGYKGLIKLDSLEGVEAAFAVIKQSYPETL